jgi:hypothetical protein
MLGLLIILCLITSVRAEDGGGGFGGGHDGGDGGGFSDESSSHGEFGDVDTSDGHIENGDDYYYNSGSGRIAVSSKSYIFNNYIIGYHFGHNDVTINTTCLVKNLTNYLTEDATNCLNTIDGLKNYVQFSDSSSDVTMNSTESDTYYNLLDQLVNCNRNILNMCITNNANILQITLKNILLIFALCFLMIILDNFM